MKKYDIIIFDLDGTISNSKEGITKCAQYALKKSGVNVEDLDSLVHFIGPPLIDTFRYTYGFSEERAKQAVALYRDRYVPIGIYEAQLYPEVEKILRKLKENGKILAIATSKPIDMAEEVLRYFGIFELFDYIMGAERIGPRQSKTDVLIALFELMKLDEKNKAVLIGDTSFDICGANNVGIDSIGVSYGFGDKKDMLDNGAVCVIDSVEELIKLLI